MAILPIKVPSVGESISEGILARWLKPDGSPVKKGDPIFELETDKASQEVGAESDGTLRTKVREGETVQVGQLVGEIDTAAVASSAPTAPASKPESTPPPPPAEKPPTTAIPSTPAPAPGPVPARETPSGDAEAISPAVRRLAAEENVDLSTVPGTGPGGRITKADVIDHLAAEKPAPAPAPAPASTRPAPSAPARPPVSRPDRETRKRMTGIRQKIAQRLVEAQQTAAILTTFNEADLSRVMALRARYKEAFQKKHGIGLGFMSFFVKAAIEALKAYPTVNARIEGAEIVQCNYYDIGVAVSTERGLMVPVVRDADTLTFAGIEQTIGDYARKARENAISVDDLQGGTFTITNGGIFGSLLSTPILNPPQSGILGMHKIQERPVVVDGQIVARPMMYLALSYDHRLVDGREAVSFLVRIKECIEDPERLMLEV